MKDVTPALSHSSRVLVIDASTDYIESIHRNYPGRALFVTDPAERQHGAEKAPDPVSEVLVGMDDSGAVLLAIRAHLERFGLTPGGVACFDCESLYLSSLIAHELGLPYPSGEAVLACRSKFISKARWRSVGLDCPTAEECHTASQADAFRRSHGGTVLIKPLCGSGSELLFFCRSSLECWQAVKIMRRRLAAMPDDRMYRAYTDHACRLDPHRAFVAEALSRGTEYSCDFLTDGDVVQVVRIARKWLKPDGTPGTALAYQIPGRLPVTIGDQLFTDTLRRAVRALGIRRALCMLDFLVDGNRIILLELAPRPGGDCLPQLLRAKCGLDIFGMELDVAEGKPLELPQKELNRTLVGLRLFAPAAGTIAAIDTRALACDPRVREVHLTRAPGHHVIMPPEDYHSRILGFAIFEPGDEETIGQECLELLGLLAVDYGGGDGA